MHPGKAEGMFKKTWTCCGKPGTAPGCKDRYACCNGDENRPGCKNNVDVRYKLVVVGDTNVGKSALVNRLRSDEVRPMCSTVGLDLVPKVLRVDDKVVCLEVWDTAGQERYQSITQAHYRGAKGIIVVYDCANPATVDSVNRVWRPSILDVCHPDTLVWLVGNKEDLVAGGRGSGGWDARPAATTLAASVHMHHTTVCAKNGHGAVEVFVDMAHALIRAGVPSGRLDTDGGRSRSSTDVPPSDGSGTASDSLSTASPVSRLDAGPASVRADAGPIIRSQSGSVDLTAPEPEVQLKDSSGCCVVS